MKEALIKDDEIGSLSEVGYEMLKEDNFAIKINTYTPTAKHQLHRGRILKKINNKKLLFGSSKSNYIVLNKCRFASK